MIYFVDNRYSNIGNYTNIGFDVTLPFYIDNFLYINDLKIRPSYTYINSHDNYTNTNSTIIPEHKFNTSFDIDITPKYHLSWNMLWVSSTTALNDGKEINMPSYFLNNAMLSMKLKKLSKLYLKVENVFNEQYQTSYGYNTKDRGYYFGIIVDM
jgi:vitamin B12 transporter